MFDPCFVIKYKCTLCPIYAIILMGKRKLVALFNCLKRDDFDFEIVNFTILNGDVPCSTSCGVLYFSTHLI